MKSLSYSIYLSSVPVQMDNVQWIVQGRGTAMSLVALRKGRKDGEELSEPCTFSSVKHRMPAECASIKENKTDTCPVSDSVIPPKRLLWLVKQQRKKRIRLQECTYQTKAYNASLTSKGSLLSQYFHLWAQFLDFWSKNSGKKST